LIQGVAAMLAEIFMVRLEAVVRPVQEKLPSSVSPFVPFSPSVPLTFKRNEDRAPEGEREKRSSKISGVDRRKGWLQEEALAARALPRGDRPGGLGNPDRGCALMKE